KQFATRNDGEAAMASLDEFGIVLRNGGTDDDGAGVAEVRGIVAHADSGSATFKAFGYRRGAKVRTADAIAHSKQDFSQPGHADSGDADKMNGLLLEKHFINLLFRLSERVSIVTLGPRWGPRSKRFQNIGGSLGGSGMGEGSRGLAHFLEARGIGR